MELQTQEICGRRLTTRQTLQELGRLAQTGPEIRAVMRAARPPQTPDVLHQQEMADRLLTVSRPVSLVHNSRVDG
jgi:hypothetical protein